jgi:hypothetical protein
MVGVEISYTSIFISRLKKKRKMTGVDENHRLENASDVNRYEAQQNNSAAPVAFTVRRGKTRKAEHSLRS